MDTRLIRVINAFNTCINCNGSFCSSLFIFRRLFQNHKSAKQKKGLHWAGVLSWDRYLSTLCWICNYFYSRNLPTAFEFSRNSVFISVAPLARALSPVPGYRPLRTLYVREFYAHVLWAHDVSDFHCTVGAWVRWEFRPIRDVIYKTSNVSDTVSRSEKRTRTRRNSVSDKRWKYCLKHR